MMQQPGVAPSLDALHDIALPEPISWAPAAPGWYVLAGLLLLAAAGATWAAYRRYRANLYRREALRQLEEIEAALADPQRHHGAALELPRLVKRVALAGGDRRVVAKLSGAPWLQFLDDTYGGDGFTRGPGKLLLRLAYEDTTGGDVDNEQLARLTALLRTWARRHRVRA